MILHDGARQTVQVGGAPVIAKTLPCLAYLRRARQRQRLQCGKATKEPWIVGLDAADLRLLQHELGHDDVVWVASATPRKLAALFTEPLQQAALEWQSILRGPWHDRT